MLKFDFIGFLIVILFTLLSILFFFKRPNKDINASIIRCFFVMYLVMLINIIFFPLPIQHMLLVELRKNNIEQTWQSIIIPLSYLHKIYGDSDWQDVFVFILQKISLTITLSLYLHMLFRNKYNRVSQVIKVFAIISISCEVIKYSIINIIGVSYKDVSIDEALLFFLGGIIGHYIYILAIKLYNILVCKVYKKQYKNECEDTRKEQYEKKY